MSVNYVRKELQAVAKIYELIRDCIAGQFAVKAKKRTTPQMLLWVKRVAIRRWQPSLVRLS